MQIVLSRCLWSALFTDTNEGMKSMVKYQRELVPERLFLISTVKAVPLNKEFQSMLEAAGVRVICGSKRNRFSHLVERYSEAGTEIIGCASVRDIELVRTILRRGGVIIACGKIVKTWCTLETTIDPGDYFFAKMRLMGADSLGYRRKSAGAEDCSENR